MDSFIYSEVLHKYLLFIVRLLCNCLLKMLQGDYLTELIEELGLERGDLNLLKAILLIILGCRYFLLIIAHELTVYLMFNMYIFISIQINSIFISNLSDRYVRKIILIIFNSFVYNFLFNNIVFIYFLNYSMVILINIYLIM